LNVEQATEVNANKNLSVLNILLIKYFMYDAKFATTDACEYLLLRSIEYFILEAAQSCKQLDMRCYHPELVYVQNDSDFLTYEAIY